jgi:hypothetical protein
MTKLPTHISQAFWCNPERGKYKFEKALIPEFSQLKEDDSGRKGDDHAVS